MKPPRAGRVVHLELHTGHPAEARDFCLGLCGWQTEPITTAGGSYLALDLGAGAAGIGGGIVPCPIPRPLWLPYVEVPEIGAATARAGRLGASILLAPREGPAGWRSVVATPAAGQIALWQPKR